MVKNYLVDVPTIPGKIYRRKAVTTSGNTIVYVEFEKERIYHPERKNTSTKRVSIGRLCEDDSTKMYPNDNYFKYISDPQLPDDTHEDCSRSSCLKVGAYYVINKIIREYGLDKLLANILDSKKMGLFLDLASYSIQCEDNAAQYYPEFAYNHLLFTEGMKVVSDSTVSRFLREVTVDDRIEFIDRWVKSRGSQEKIYVSYDATNKQCQAGDIEIVEPGHPKVGKDGDRIYNYSIAYDQENKVPLLYEKYPGSINDVSQFKHALDKIEAFGYKRIIMILDRGYFGKPNIEEMDHRHVDFVMMVKGNKDVVNSLILEHKGEFEDKYSNYIPQYGVNGMTIASTLFQSDTESRYFHLYFSSSRYNKERTDFLKMLSSFEKNMTKAIGTDEIFPSEYHKYFELFYKEETRKSKDEDGNEIEKKVNILQAYAPIGDAIEQEIDLCGYFAIISSYEMTAKEAIITYKSRDATEKLFRGDKSYLGNKSTRVYTDEATETKIFIEFVALIIRNRIYTCLLEETMKSDQKANFMTVPAAIKELSKIEAIKQADGVYRLDHAITKTQKTILKAFGISPATIMKNIQEISEQIAPIK